MEKILLTPEKLIIKLEANESLLNAIRRSVEEIDVVAIDEVEIFKNDSVLYDEVLAHRIGLIPLAMDRKVGEKTEIQLKLSKTGPCWVYSGDLKGGIKPANDKIPITILEEGQVLEFVATARLGKSIEHAKYVPGLCYYRHLAEIKSKNQKIEKIIEESKGVIKPSKIGDSWICDLDEASIEEIERIDRETVKDSSEVLFFIESFGQMEAKKILLHAIETLNNNLEKTENYLK